MNQIIKLALKNQYKSALQTLREAILRCPDSLWSEQSSEWPYWQLVYHTLFYTDLYLSQSLELFTPAVKNGKSWQNPDTDGFQSKTDMLEYFEIVEAKVDREIDDTDLGRNESGFDWYPISKLDHEILNIRHIMIHVGHLDIRLRQAGQEALTWR